MLTVAEKPVEGRKRASYFVGTIQWYLEKKIGAKELENAGFEPLDSD